MKAKAPWVLVGLVGLLLSCGQKGPLVLPDAQHPQKKVKLPAAPKTPRAPATPTPETSGDDPAPPGTDP